MSDESLAWVSVGGCVDNRMFLNRGRWIDKERATAVWPFISGVWGRAQQWQLIHQPQGHYWASWNRTKSIFIHFSSFLFSSLPWKKHIPHEERHLRIVYKETKCHRWTWTKKGETKDKSLKQKQNSEWQCESVKNMCARMEERVRAR